MVEPAVGVSLSAAAAALPSSLTLTTAGGARGPDGAGLALGRLPLCSSNRGPRGSRALAAGMGTRGRGARSVSALMRCLSAAAFSAAAFCRHGTPQPNGQGDVMHTRRQLHEGNPVGSDSAGPACQKRTCCCRASAMRGALLDQGVPQIQPFGSSLHRRGLALIGPCCRCCQSRGPV